VGDDEWRIALSEFPQADGPYELIVNGEVVDQLLEWPDVWDRPLRQDDVGTAPSEQGEPDDRHERGAFEEAMRHLDRTRDVKPSRRV
jgi:hypothetical protein